MNRWLASRDKSSNCVAIVDWRLIKYLHATLSNKSIPWILLDRSPPADKGLLAKLQWPIWKKSWRLVSKPVILVVLWFHHPMVNSFMILFQLAMKKYSLYLQ